MTTNKQYKYLKKWIAVCVGVLVFMTGLPSMVVNAGTTKDNFFIEYDHQVYQYKSKIVTVSIDGKEVKTGDMPAVSIEDRTLVPVREVFESPSIGAKVEWNSDTQEIYVSYKDKFIVLKIDSKTAYVNSVPYELDVPPKLIRDASKKNAKTMIPLRFVSENLGFGVKWDSNTFSALLTSPVVEVAPVTPTAAAVTTMTAVTDDPTNVSQQLETLSAQKAKRTLPTALSSAPIVWTAATTSTATTTTGSGVTTVVNKVDGKELSLVDITDVLYTTIGTSMQFEVSASNPISAVSYLLLDKRVVIDIKNANCKLSSNKTFENNPLVTGIRSSQFSLTPATTRLVLDLKSEGNAFNLALSTDRKKLIVSVVNNGISQMELSQNENGDYIKVKGAIGGNVKAFRLSNPNRIVFDFIGAQSAIGTKSAIAQGQYVTTIRTAQFDANTSRIVVETDGQADYNIQSSGDETFIQLNEPTIDNIEYQNTDTPVITLETNAKQIDLNLVKYVDDYMNHQYTIILPGNYSDLFGSGDIKVDDANISSINLVTDPTGNTNIVIQEKSVYEFRLEKTDKGFTIKGYKPQRLYKKILVVDAGHGGSDPGAVAGTVFEKNINLATVLYLKELLANNKDIKVYYTRIADNYPTLQDRVDLANEVEADMFLSIHNNSLTPTYTGTETLYMPGVNQVGLDSIEMAQIYHNKFITSTGMLDRGLKSRESLFVLKNTSMPAIIVEMGFVTNAADVAKLVNADFQKLCAQALYDATVEVFNQYPTGR